MNRNSKWKHVIVSDEVDEVFGSYDNALKDARRELYERDTTVYESPESISDDDALEEVYAMLRSDWDDFWVELKHASNRYSGHWLMTADLGLWNGRREGGMVFQDVYSAVMQCVANMDYCTIHEDDYGNVRITGIHHDGTNYYYIYRLSDRGEKWLASHSDENREHICRTLDKPHYRRAAKLLGLLYGKRYRHANAA